MTLLRWKALRSDRMDGSVELLAVPGDTAGILEVDAAPGGDVPLLPGDVFGVGKRDWRLVDIARVAMAR